MGRVRKDAGRHWERLAAEHVVRAGLEIIERNYTCRFGEIDLIGLDRKVLVIIEVKARSESRFGTAVESVDGRKQQKILNAARHYLMRNPKRAALPLRFDVIGIDAIDSARPRLNWVRNAFDAT